MLLLAPMPDDLRTLLRLRGLSPTNCLGPVFGVTICRIARGSHRVRAGTAQKIATGLSIPIETILAACDESWRRAHGVTPDAPVGPGADRQEGSAETHAGSVVDGSPS